MNGRWIQIAPLTGVLAVVLVVVAFLVGGDTPDGDAPPQEVVSFFTDHDSGQTVAAVLLAYAAAFLVFFAGILRSVLRKGEDAPGGPSAVAFGGALIAAVGMLLFSGLTFTLADFSDSLDPAAAQALNALNEDMFLPLAIGWVVFMLAAGIAWLRSAMSPRWLGWAAVVIGVVSATPVGFIGIPLGGLWILAVSILLARRPATA
jgi:hypothetical protein